MVFRPVASIFGTLGAYVLYRVFNMVYAELTSPLRYLPGPKSTHWFFGNLKELASNMRLLFYGFLAQGQLQLYITDNKVLHHFLSNTQIYQKSELTRFSLGRIVGPGILVVDGDVHKQQRKIVNPAFGAPQIRELTGILVEKSIQLRDIRAAEAAQGGGVARVEVLSWLSKATLDIIGLADAPNELAAAFEVLFGMETEFSVMRAIRAYFRIFRRIIAQASQATMMRIGRQLLADSKRDITENGTFETGRARDLLSLLVRANTSKDIPASQWLSDDDVLAREPPSTAHYPALKILKEVPTFLVARHETTSTAVTSALFALTHFH
ncbi:cytochrome P450 [Mycena sp. CBHHK59/15]|nr:cytochrome P450 [Mycena sp. CBHHK59/15]